MFTLPRLPLSDQAGLRVFRWLARALTIASLWPLWYAFNAKSSVDEDALGVGLPGVVFGVIAWWWSGYRVRHPSHGLEIDRVAGEVRLLRGRSEPEASCTIAALGDWTYRTWTTTTTHNGVRSSTTWHAARCPGLGAEDLFVATSAEACREWAARVDAVTRRLPLDELDVSADEITEVMRSHGIAEGDANEMLHAAAARAGGAARIERVHLEAAALALRPGLGGRAVALFDAITQLGSIAAPVILGILALAALAFEIRLVLETQASASTECILVALFAALIALGLREVELDWLAALTAAILGVPLIAKPFVAPITNEYMGEVFATSPTSETHLYYLLPGLALLALGAVLAVTRRRRPVDISHRAALAPVEFDPLDPPPPEPPGRG